MEGNDARAAAPVVSEAVAVKDPPGHLKKLTCLVVTRVKDEAWLANMMGMRMPRLSDVIGGDPVFGWCGRDALDTFYGPCDGVAHVSWGGAQRKAPSSLVKAETAREIEALSARDGRRVTRGERKEIRQRVEEALTQSAQWTLKALRVIVAEDAGPGGLVFTDAVSDSQVDAVCGALSACGLAVCPVCPETAGFVSGTHQVEGWKPPEWLDREWMSMGMEFLTWCVWRAIEDGQAGTFGIDTPVKVRRSGNVEEVKAGGDENVFRMLREALARRRAVCRLPILCECGCALTVGPDLRVSSVKWLRGDDEPENAAHAARAVWCALWELWCDYARQRADAEVWKGVSDKMGEWLGSC